MIAIINKNMCAGRIKKILSRYIGEKCAYCGTSYSKKSLTVDHVFPRCLGGRRTLDNSLLSCRKCNEKKAGRLPDSSEIQKLRRQNVLLGRALS